MVIEVSSLVTSISTTLLAVGAVGSACLGVLVVLKSIDFIKSSLGYSSFNPDDLKSDGSIAPKGEFTHEEMQAHYASEMELNQSISNDEYEARQQESDDKYHHYSSMEYKDR